MSTEEIVKRLCGEITPIGETNTDKENFENLFNYEAVLLFVTDKLRFCTEYKDDPRYSVNKIGKKAFDILKANYEYIKDIMEEK